MSLNSGRILTDLLPVPRKDKYDFTNQVLDFSKQIVENRLSAEVVPLGELVSFVNEVHTSTSIFKLFEMIFDFRNPSVGKPRPSSLNEVVSWENLQGSEGFRVVSRYRGFPYDR